MHAVDLLDAEALDEAVLDHGEAAGEAFLVGLEHDHHRAVEVARLAQILGGAEQHGRVPVVAARVHLARRLGCVRNARHLLDRQGVHVGAQPDRGRAVALAQHADDAGAADADMHLDAERFKFLRDDIRGAMLLEAELRMGVKVAAPRGQLRVIVPDAVDGAHDPVSGCLSDIARERRLPARGRMAIDGAMAA